MDINLLYQAKEDRGFDIYELYGLQGEVILRKFGRFNKNFYSFESINKLERRQNLLGLTLRYFQREGWWREKIFISYFIFPWLIENCIATVECCPH